MYTWLYSWFTNTEVALKINQQSTPKDPEVYRIDRGFTFTESLKKVKLKPIPDKITNVSFGQTIRDVKHRLKPVVQQLSRCEKTPRHPVLKELLEKTPKTCP